MARTFLVSLQSPVTHHYVPISAAVSYSNLGHEALNVMRMIAEKDASHTTTQAAV
jgi:hypothetical protein